MTPTTTLAERGLDAGAILDEIRRAETTAEPSTRWVFDHLENTSSSAARGRRSPFA